MTNHEKIKSMTVEEMADFLANRHLCAERQDGNGQCAYFTEGASCTDCMEGWLESEVGEWSQSE